MMFRLKLLVITGLLLCGCSGPAEQKGDPSVMVKGTVTLDGQPLPNGQILFIDEDRKPRREYLAAIQEGAFQCEAPPGKKRVEIISYKPTTSLEVVPPQIIPARYNDKSELSVELVLNDPAEHAFELKSNQK